MSREAIQSHDGDQAAPWDPQPGEPGTSFAGFVVYRETSAPGRSLRAVAAKLGRSLSLVERYSSRWNWLARTRAWEGEQARQRSADARHVEANWIERHMDAGRRLQSLGLAGLSQLVEPGADGQNSLRQLKPAEAVRMLTAGSAIEVTAASHASATIEEEFVQRVIEMMASVFVEANRHDEEEQRARAFQEGCLRALRELVP